MHDKIQRFSLRKLSVGLASVMVGACIFSVNGKTVKADVTSDQTTQKADVQDQTATAQAQNEKQQTSSAQNSVADQSQNNLLDDLGKQKASTENNQVEAKNQENRLVDQINYKLTDNGSTDSKEDLGRNLTAPDETKSTSTTKSDAEKSIVSPSSAQKINNQSNDHAEDNSQSQPQNSQRLNKKVLATNLIETNSSPMTNGGFDEATWGKLDVNDWKGNVQGDYYQLTDYTGDANHVIVPNEADFEKAGISTSGKQVGVTRDLMHTIFRDKTTAQDATVAFSKTDNKQVKAINADWKDTWGHHYSNDSKAKLSKFDGTNLDVSNVTNMSWMFDNNQISDLSLLANWKVDNVKDMSWMFGNNHIDNLSLLANWKVDHVTNMRYMFHRDQISDLSPLANWKIDNVEDMSEMFSFNQISDLSPLANWKVNNVKNMNWMFEINQIRDLSPISSWNVNNVTNMGSMFSGNQISNLSPLANWDVSNVTDMDLMFDHNRISNLSPLANWNVNNVTDMGYMFRSNYISDLSPLASWKTDNVTDMSHMFDDNVTTQTKNLPAKRVINFVYPAGYTGKKQDTITQTVNVPQEVKVELITKDSKPSNNILDWATKKETPQAPDTVYFQDYTVPTVSNLGQSISTVAKQEADPNKPINVTVTYTVAPVTVYFSDVDENADKDPDAIKQELGKTVSLTGKYGDKIDLTHVKIPDGFELDNTSTSNTFGNTTDAYNVNIFSHLYILIKRFRRGKKVQYKDKINIGSKYHHLKESNSIFWKVSNDVIHNTADYIHREIPSAEIYYLLEYLISMRYNHDFAIDDKI